MEKKENIDINADHKLETFISLLIKMIETSETHTQIQIESLTTIICAQQETVDKIKDQINKMKISSAVNTINNSLRTKLIISVTTVLILVSTAIVRYNNEICKYISSFFK